MPDLPPILQYSYERFDDPMVKPPADPREPGDPKPIDAHEIEVERDEARQILQDIQDKIDERSKLYRAGEIVLGVEPYLKADVYCRMAYEEPLENVLAPEVTVIPGDSVAPVIPTQKRIEEHLSERDSDAE